MSTTKSLISLTRKNCPPWTPLTSAAGGRSLPGPPPAAPPPPLPSFGEGAFVDGDPFIDRLVRGQIVALDCEHRTPSKRLPGHLEPSAIKHTPLKNQSSRQNPGDQVEALLLANRIVVLNGGIVQQIGTPLELYQTPANRFVAQFIGSPTMNILGVSPTDGGVRLANGAEITLPGITGPVAELGIRPEHLDIVDPVGAVLTGTADVVEHLGSDTNVYVLVDGVGPLMVRQHGHIGLRAGDRLGLTIQPGQTHAFASDGRALRG